MNEQTKLDWADKKEFTIQELSELGYDQIRRTWIVDGKPYKLSERGWSFGFNNHKRSLGMCYHRRKRIELSLEYAKLNTDKPAVIEEVIRHEIAHAIDFLKRGKSGHDKAWKGVCVQVGANPVRCHSNKDTERPVGKYTLKCDKCGTVYYKHRMVSDSYSCGTCSPKAYSSKFKLEVIKNW